MFNKVSKVVIIIYITLLFSTPELSPFPFEKFYEAIAAKNAVYPNQIPSIVFT